MSRADEGQVQEEGRYCSATQYLRETAPIISALCWMAIGFSGLLVQTVEIPTSLKPPGQHRVTSRRSQWT